MVTALTVTTNENILYKSFNAIFQLAIFKTRKQMISAINKHYKNIDVTYVTKNNCMGMFSPTYHKMADDAPGLFSSNVFGKMFLNLSDISDEVIAHECGHAAFAYEQFVRRYTGNYDDDEFNEQEDFCYFLGFAFKEVKQAVKKFKANING